MTETRGAVRGRWPRHFASAPGYQRHHILPTGLLGRRQFHAFFAALGDTGFAFDDPRRNGILLPALPRLALASGRALHRGPHHGYSRIVAARVERIRLTAVADAATRPHGALAEANMRLALLQAALRRTLDGSAPRWVWLNRRDPMRLYAEADALDRMIADMFPDGA